MEIQAYRHEITGGERGGKKGGGREEWGPEGKNCTVQCTQHGDTVNKMTGKFKNISIKTIQYKLQRKENYCAQSHGFKYDFLTYVK